MINDILDLSKIEAGQLTLDEGSFRLAQVLDDLGAMMAALAADKQLELVIQTDEDAPEQLIGDAVRLTQILTNLVGNAIKFTDRGRVALTVSCDTLDANATLLSCTVTDTGIGMDAEALARLFSVFTQGDSSMSRKYGGTGLGLAICKRLVNMMGGEIGIHSEHQRGSTFWFTARMAKTINPTLSATPFNLPVSRALVVDDNETNRKVLRHQLAYRKVPHDAVASGPAALSALRSAALSGSPFDLVLLDYHMPDMDGLALAKLIAAQSDIPMPKMILITSLGDKLNQIELREHRLAVCLLKPVKPVSLFESIYNAMTSSPPLPIVSHPISAVTAEPDSKIKILVVDDNAINQSVTGHQLLRLGYRCDFANNGQEAFEALHRRPYDIVFMDEQMPVLDGLEATRLIREAQAAGDPAIARHLRIIALTANALPSERERLLLAGMDDYLSKPVTTAVLHETLSRNLEAMAQPRQPSSAAS